VSASIRRAPLLCAAALLALLAIAPAAAGAAPRLDPTFGQGDRAEPILEPAYEPSSFSAATVGADGSLLTLRRRDLIEPIVVRERFLADGRRDLGFKSETLYPGPEVLDASGRTLRTSSVEHHTLERLDRDGLPDPSFGQGRARGSDSVPFQIEAILPLPSGKIVVAGTYHLLEGRNPTYLTSVARFEPTGALDQSFGVGGIVAVGQQGGHETEELIGLTLGQGEDAIVTFDREQRSEDGGPARSPRSSIVALGATGQVDPTFGSSGVIASSRRIDAVQGLAGGGLLLVADDRRVPRRPRPGERESDISLVRLMPSGTPDPAFGGGDGENEVDLGGFDTAAALLLRADGSILVGGVTTVPHLTCIELIEPLCEATPVLVGFDSAGMVDRAFGREGVLRLDPLSFDFAPLKAEGVNFLRELPGGGILAGGGTGKLAFLAELGPAGGLRPGFGKGGIVTVSHPVKSVSVPHQIVLDRAGRIVVLGATNAGQSEYPRQAVFRLRPGGALDRAYGGGRGFARVPGNPLAPAPDDRGGVFVLSGRLSPNSVSRLTAAGRPDLSFGDGGVVSLPEHVSTVVAGRRRNLEVDPHTVTPMPDGGAIVSTLISGLPGPNRIGLLRLTASGARDRSFGRDGMVVLALGRRGECGVHATAVLPDGDLVLGGWVGVMRRRTLRREAALFRVRPDGSLDRSFGAGGVAALPIRGEANFTALAIGPGGEIVAGGHADVPSRRQPLTARFTSTGRLDRGFFRRGVETRRGPAKAATGPSKIVFWAGQIAIAGRGQPWLYLYARDGSFERRLVLGRRTRPRTAVEGIAVQRGRLLVATKTRGDRSFAVERLVPGSPGQ
jgi:uncharacterized delta-60 repeat protein